MSNQTILVIGGAGYIGSHAVKELLQHGYSVVVLDNLSKGHREAINMINPSIPLFIGDLGDPIVLEKIFSQYNISVVMHFAALIEVGASVLHPDIYYNNNVVKVLTLLDTMYKHQINYFVFSSTAATFGSPQEEKITETHPQNPINPYGSSKLMIEWILRDYAYAFPKFCYSILRYFNACGADHSGLIGASYEPATLLITATLQAALGKRSSIQIFGTDYNTPDGTGIRDYIHVTDLATAHILSMKRMLSENISESYNLGTGSGHSVREVINTVKEITKVCIPIEEVGRRIGDPAILVANSKKAQTTLHWNAKYMLHDMISSAWHWEKNKTY